MVRAKGPNQKVPSSFLVVVLTTSLWILGRGPDRLPRECMRNWWNDESFIAMIPLLVFKRFLKLFCYYPSNLEDSLKAIWVWLKSILPKMDLHTNTTVNRTDVCSPETGTKNFGSETVANSEGVLCKQCSGMLKTGCSSSSSQKLWGFWQTHCGFLGTECGRSQDAGHLGSQGNEDGPVSKWVNKQCRFWGSEWNPQVETKSSTTCFSGIGEPIGGTGEYWIVVMFVGFWL